MLRRSAFRTAGLLILAGLGSFWLIGSVTRSRQQVLLRFTQNQVKVEVVQTVQRDGRISLAATFTPQEGFQLYANRLPDAGVAGVGRPTRFDLSRPLPAGLTLAAMPQEQPAPTLKHDASLNIDLPLYPAGAVTLTYHGKISKMGIRLPVAFSYMSCHTTRGCTIPVQQKKAVLEIVKP